MVPFGTKTDSIALFGWIKYFFVEIFLREIVYILLEFVKKLTDLVLAVAVYQLPC